MTNDFPAVIEKVYQGIQVGFLSNSADPSSERIEFIIPTLEEILSVEAELRPLWENQKKSSCCLS